MRHASNPREPLSIGNTLHRANTHLALGQATQSHLRAFGFSGDDASGKN
jgi:hypothetical protein